MQKYHNTKDFKKHYLPGLPWHDCHWICYKTMACGRAEEWTWTPDPVRDSACLPAPPAAQELPALQRYSSMLLLPISVLNKMGAHWVIRNLKLSQEVPAMRLFSHSFQKKQCTYSQNAWNTWKSPKCDFF